MDTTITLLKTRHQHQTAMKHPNRPEYRGSIGRLLKFLLHVGIDLRSILDEYGLYNVSYRTLSDGSTREYKTYSLSHVHRLRDCDGPAYRRVLRMCWLRTVEIDLRNKRTHRYAYNYLAWRYAFDVRSMFANFATAGPIGTGIDELDSLLFRLFNDWE